MRLQLTSTEMITSAKSAGARIPFRLPRKTREKLSGNICPAGLRLNDEIFRGTDTRQIMSSLLNVGVKERADASLCGSVSGDVASDLTFPCRSDDRILRCTLMYEFYPWTTPPRSSPSPSAKPRERAFAKLPRLATPYVS